MKNSTKAKNTESKTNEGRAVVPARAVSIECMGGMIEGIFVATRQRMTDKGEIYQGHVIDGQGIFQNRADKQPVALPAARYFVFGKTRLDRFMQEVQAGDRVKITYQGMEANETGEGQHHAYNVVLL